MADNIIKRGGIWQFKMMLKGKVVRQSLDTSDKVVALGRAKKFRKDLEQDRWDRVWGDKKEAALATVGEVVERFQAARELQNKERTRRDCGNYLLKIVEVGLPTKDPAGQSVSVLTQGLVYSYQRAVLAAAKPGNLAQDAASESANSAHTQARSVFSKKAMQREIYKGLNLGAAIEAFCKAQELTVLPKDNYQPPERDLVAKVWQAAETDLRPKNPHAWMVFWLASMSGLRKGEILAARWCWLTDTAVALPLTEDFVTKGKRARLIPSVPDLRAQALATATAAGWSTGPEDLVLPGTTQKDRQNVFREFGVWMKGQGWQRRQKAHELRKLFATAVCKHADAYTAQMALGHQQIETTMRYAARPELKAINAAEEWGKKPATPAAPPVLTVLANP